MQVSATFKSTGWEETPYAEVEGLAKLTRVSCTQEYRGEVEGKATLQYLMTYSGDGAATFVGIERVVGTVAGREGSFVLQHAGRFEGGVAKLRMTVVEGAGTGALAGLSGGAEFESAHCEEYPITFEFEMDGPSP